MTATKTTEELVAGVSGIICPFCGEEDFDLIGLKIHLIVGWCDPFKDCPTSFKTGGLGSGDS